MSQGMFTAVAGISANQSSLNVISNNISNMNTVAFKSSTVFQKALSAQIINSGSAPTGTLGGVNPSQIGSGVQVSDIATNFNQGGTQFTGQNTDLTIQGSGFFVLQDGDSTVLTRAGTFSLDSSGNLVDSSTGRRVQGSSQKVGSGSTVINSVYVPTEVQFAKDTNATGGIVKTWLANSTASGTDWATGTLALATGATGRTVETGKLVSFSISNTGAITATYSNGDRLSVRVDPNSVTAGDPTTARTEIIHLPAEGGTYGADNDANGTSNDANDAGVVNQHITASLAVFTAPAGGTAMQGMQMNLQNATVVNPKGLIYDGSNAYTTGPNSGDVAFGHPGSENRGGLQSGALESSNVDLASEFTKMILSQRAVEANSRTLSTISQVLQTLINNT